MACRCTSTAGRYFYPRPPRGGRRAGCAAHKQMMEISIHALREEGDMKWDRNKRMYHISIHALREEGDEMCRKACAEVDRFLSTPSARRATPDFCPEHGKQLISIHALREEGDAPSSRHKCREHHISIHALREEGDPVLPEQSIRHEEISIHALREEGDPASCPRKRPRPNFYPRPPRGGRPAVVILAVCRAKFLSTPSARRATDHPGLLSRGVDISIHALREEGDSKNRDKISIFKQIIQHSARI